MPLASKRTKGEVNQPEDARRNCSQGVAAGWPCRTQYTRSIVSSPRSSDGLEEEVIPTDLHDVLVLWCRRRADLELRRKELVPGLWRARTNQNALAGSLQRDQPAQPKGLCPVGRELDA